MFGETHSRRLIKSLSEDSKERMRMSCNGCRVLRKGCSESCILRPCLEWIRSAEAQANATVFLAKFYGRSGLMKLLNSGPNHLRPVIFRSLLYEACGRIINPIYGSVGLQWSGNWHSCQAAVESVLKGQPLQMEGTSDIKPSPSTLIDSILTDRPLKLRNRSRFKRSQHRKSTTHLEKLDDTTDSQVYNLKCQKEFESMFQVIQEENQMKEKNQKKANNDKKVATNYPVQNIVKVEANVELEQFQEVGNGVEEMFQSNEMEIFGDDSHGREIDENDVELELRLGSPTSHEAVQTLADFKKSPTSHEAVQTLTDFKMSQRHWSSHQNGCKDHPLPNFTSLSLALS